MDIAVGWTCHVCGLPSTRNDACGTCRAARPGHTPRAVEDEAFTPLHASRVFPLVIGLLVGGFVLAAEVGHVTRWGARGMLVGMTLAERESAILELVGAIRAHARHLQWLPPGPVPPAVKDNLQRVRTLWERQDTSGARREFVDAEREVRTALGDLASLQGAVVHRLDPTARQAAAETLEMRLVRVEELLSQ